MEELESGEAPLSDFIVNVPDYPKPGIVFKDITPLLADGKALRRSITALAKHFQSTETERIAGIEARGFILGAAVAAEMGIGFLPLRKPGKSPRAVHSIRYELEYGFDSMNLIVLYERRRPGWGFEWYISERYIFERNQCHTFLITFRFHF